MVLELYDLGSEGARDLTGVILALGVDHVHLPYVFQRLEAAGQITTFVSGGDNHAYWKPRGRLC